jgi:hypothetical protein
VKRVFKNDQEVLNRYYFYRLYCEQHLGDEKGSSPRQK